MTELKKDRITTFQLSVVPVDGKNEGGGRGREKEGNERGCAIKDD